MERWDVVVVGAGASGLMAAQAAARTLKAQGSRGGAPGGGQSQTGKKSC